MITYWEQPVNLANMKVRTHKEKPHKRIIIINKTL